MARSDDLSEALAPLPAWRGLLGYDQALNTWQGLVQRERLPSPLLLVGRAGIGKRSLLAALTAMHYCEVGTACGECVQCRYLLSGKHPEVLWMEVDDGAAFLTDDACKLQDHLALSPGPGARYRTVVLVDADRLTEAAANRLLKVIEEPPPGARLFLSTSRVGAVLPTILSRLVRWHLPPPPLALSLQWLAKESAAAGLSPLPAAELEDLLKRSALSPGMAWRELSAAAEQKGGGFSLLPQTATAAEMVEWAETCTRQQGRSAAQLIEQWDVSLNQYYRKVIASGVAPDSGVVARTQRRDLLRRARGLARGARVPLNAQLLAEALALTQRS